MVCRVRTKATSAFHLYKHMHTLVLILSFLLLQEQRTSGFHKRFDCYDSRCAIPSPPCPTQSKYPQSSCQNVAQPASLPCPLKYKYKYRSHQSICKGAYLIFVIFLHRGKFLVQFFSTQKCVNRNKTDFVTKQRKFCEKP